MSGAALSEQTRLLKIIAKALTRDSAQVGEAPTKEELERREQYSGAWVRYWRDLLKKQPLEGKCHAIIERISDVAPAAHMFSADIFVTVSFEVSESFEVDLFDPQIVLSNIIEETHREDWFTSSPLRDGKKEACYKTRARGTFSAHMELTKYPVDMQSLSIWITTYWEHEALRLVPGGLDPVMNSWAWSTLRDEWDIASIQLPDGCIMGVVGASASESRHSASSTGTTYSTLRFNVHIARKSRYFLWNIVLISFVLATLAFTSFYVKPEDVADRASITLTLLLTVVAFKQSASQDLPKVAFLTALDQYLIFALSIVSAIVVANAVVGVIEDDDERQDQDNRCLTCLSVLWFGGNLGFIIALLGQLRARHCSVQQWKKSSNLEDRNDQPIARDKVKPSP